MNKVMRKNLKVPPPSFEPRHPIAARNTHRVAEAPRRSSGVSSPLHPRRPCFSRAGTAVPPTHGTALSGLRLAPLSPPLTPLLLARRCRFTLATWLLSIIARTASTASGSTCCPLRTPSKVGPARCSGGTAAAWWGQDGFFGCRLARCLLTSPAVPCRRLWESFRHLPQALLHGGLQAGTCRRLLHRAPGAFPLVPLLCLQCACRP